MQILCATDGSEGSTAAAQFLARLALTAEDSVLLLAVEPGCDHAESCLDRSAQALAGSPARVERETRSGPAAEQILACAQERPTDLIAIGAMGVSGLTQFFMGSVAERVLRHAEVPVLVARPILHDLRRALVAVDGSIVAERVVQAAGALPLPGDIELRLVTVLPPMEATVSVAPMIWSALSGNLEEILATARQDAEARLRTLAQPLQQAGRNVSAELQSGEAAASLIANADREQADLILLGSRGEGGVDRFLLGSVTERVARHAHCSVFVVR